MNTMRRLAVAVLVVAATGGDVSNAQYPPPSGPPYDERQRYPDQRYPGYDDRYDDRYDDYDRWDRYDSPDWEVGFFYGELSPYGDWIWTRDYGWAWLPRDIGYGWRPYLYGRWVPSNYGWYWVSYEPFGWATYHYGRWAWHPRFGWLWTPGRVWGPSWVTWRSGGGYLGWAPLPPEVGFRFGVGLDFGGLNLSVSIRPEAFVFVGERHFLEPRLDRHFAPAARNVTIVRNTTIVNNYTVIDNRVVNRGIDFGRVERATGRKIRTVRIEETQSQKVERVSGDRVIAYRPPRQKLDSVRVDESKPKRGRDEIERELRRLRPPQADGSQRGRVERKEGDIAPRVEIDGRSKRAPSGNRGRGQDDAAEFERRERQRLDRAQQEERRRQASAAEAEAVSKRQNEEKRALDEQLKRSRQEMTERREIERKAARVAPPAREQKPAEQGRKGETKQAGGKQSTDAAQKGDDKTDKSDKAAQPKSKGRKKPPSAEAPPPFRG